MERDRAVDLYYLWPKGEYYVGAGAARVRWTCTIGALAMLASSAPAAAENGAEARFKAIYSQEWAWRKRQTADDEDSGSIVRANLPDVGPAAQAERLKTWTDVMAKLDAFPVADLGPEARVDFAVYRAQVAALLASQRFRDFEKPLNADTSFWGNVAEAARRTFRTEQDYRNYIVMLGAIPRYFDQQIINMKAGEQRGFTPPRITLEGRDATAAAIVDVPTAEANPYYAPFETMPTTIPAATRATLRAKGAEVIRNKVVPAYRALLSFLRDDYIPHAKASLDAYSLPDGRAYYRAKIEEFTTLPLSPDEIHAIGLAEVAKIRAEMLSIIQEEKFAGDLPAFLTYLRTDPRFYAKTPQELLDRAAWIAKTFDGKAAAWFGRLPRSRFAIRPVPTDIAPFYTGGRGGPGVYLVNTYALSSRPLYSLTALTLHESAPGHAFQMPLAAENIDLPDFRRETYVSAYGEGWALYCEKLGVEMGMYDTPYDRFGMLSYQMWRAARLVVDTGLHSKGWSRAKAQAYLHDNTALADHEIETEVDRYIAWPAQALSYYLGEMAIIALRAKAERALGARFNIRAFHDTVLQMGSVPIPVLQARVDRFIAEGGISPYSERPDTIRRIQP